MDLINLPDPEGLAHRLSPIKEEAPIKQNETIRNKGIVIPNVKRPASGNK